MLFVRPYEKAVARALKKTPLFSERWFFCIKKKDHLRFEYNEFQTRLHEITGGDATLLYHYKDARLQGELTFPFLDDCPEFERLCSAVETMPDWDIDDTQILAERKHKPPRLVVVVTMENVTKKTFEKAAARMLDALSDVVASYNGENNDDYEEEEDEE